MAVRLLLVAHGRTPGLRDAVFGDHSGLDADAPVEPLTGRVASWFCAPEPACGDTARRLGGAATVVEELRGLATGDWQGFRLADVAVADPPGLAAWLADPYARPHGGESLAELIARVGRAADHRSWPPGRTVVVTTPLTVRALMVYALAAPPEMIFGIDVAALGSVQLTRNGGRWRLRVG